MSDYRKDFTGGFTLLELLIVIGILAILSSVVVLVLNPAELLKQARDSQRLSDISSLKSAISLYLSSVSDPDLSGGPGDFGCVDEAGPTFGASASSGAVSRFQGASNAAHSGILKVDGTGWAAVNLGSITGGSPLSVLPRDPVNDATRNYQYACDAGDLTFEISADLESKRYSLAGSDDMESADGGNSSQFYEAGNDPDLDL